MRHAQRMWTFETKSLRVIWEIAPDDDCDTSFDETGETAKKIASGEWFCFVSRIFVQHKATGAVLGEDYLGGSIYETPAEFRDHIGRNAQGYGSYFSDMVRQACDEARKALADIKSTPLRHA